MSAPGRIQVDLPGLVGVGLLVCLAVFYLIAIRPLQSTVAELESQARAIQTRTKPVAPRNAAAAATRPDLASSYADSLRSAYSQLIPATDAAATFITLNESAAGAGLKLQSGDYRSEAIPDSILVRYRVSLVTRGTFSQIRDFVEHVIASVPTASLDELQLNRTRIEESRIDAKIGFTVYLRGERTGGQ